MEIPFELLTKKTRTANLLGLLLLLGTNTKISCIFQDLEMQSILNHMLHWEQKISRSHFSQYSAIYSEHAKTFNELKEFLRVAVKSISDIRSCVQVKITCNALHVVFLKLVFNQYIHIYTHTYKHLN